MSRLPNHIDMSVASQPERLKLVDHRARRSPSLALVAVGIAIWLVWPAQSLARAVVRFIHAVPGVGRAQVRVRQGDRELSFGEIAFGQVSRWHGLRSGRFRWSVLKGATTLAKGTATVHRGAYDLVLLAKPGGVGLGVYRSRGGRPDTSLIRIIHAAPELGSPELQLNSEIIRRSLGYTQATPYLSVTPGINSVAALKAGDSTPLASARDLRLSAGAAYSAIVIGSRGQRVRIVTVTDRGAPLTRRTRLTRDDAGPRLSGATVIVHRGDSLWKIAQRRLGAGASVAAVQREVVAIWDLNAARIGTGDPSLIFPGTRLVLPRR